MTALSPTAALALRRAYLDLFLLASRLMAGAGRPQDALPLRDNAQRSLEQQRAQLLPAGVPESVVNEAQLAISCLLDEAAMRDRGFGASWPALQRPQQQDLSGGEAFFQHLAVLRQGGPLELFEIYVRCVLLGFQGMYAPDRLRDLQILKDALRTELSGRLGAAPPLSPHLQDLGGRQDVRPLLGWHFAPAVAIALLCVVVLGLYVRLSGQSRETTQQIEQLGKAAAGGRP